VEPFLPDGRRRQHRTARLRAPRRGDANLREVITGKVRRIHLRRPDLGVSKRPITPIRAQRVPINRLDKPKSWPAPPPVRRRTRPVTTAEQHTSNSDPPANGGDPLHPGQD
jgi:hypothetical protein